MPFLIYEVFRLLLLVFYFRASFLAGIFFPLTLFFHSFLAGLLSALPLQRHGME